MVSEMNDMLNSVNYREKYLKLVEDVRCVIESYDYLDLGEVDGSSYKLSKCIHGEFVYNGCESCITEFLSKAIDNE